MREDTNVAGAGNNKRIVTTVKLELADRLKANESLAKYKKLFADQVEVTVNPIRTMTQDQLADRAVEIKAKLPKDSPLLQRLPELMKGGSGR
jgi:hypothetical protein